MSSIKKKILILTLLPFMALIVVTTIAISFQISRYLEIQTKEELLSIAALQSAKVEKTLFRIESSLSVLSESCGLWFNKQAYIDNGDLYLTDYRDEIAPLLLSTAGNIDNSNGIYFMFSPEIGEKPSQVWYFDEELDGSFERIVEYPDPEDFNRDDPSLEYYYHPLESEEAYWSQPYTDIDVDIIVFSYTRPVWSGSEIIGIVGLDLSLDSIKNEISDFRYLKDGYAFLLDSMGNVIYHPQFTLNTPMEVALGDTLTDLVEEFESENIRNTYNYFYYNELKWLGYHRMTNNWLLGVTITEKEMFQPVRNIQKIIITISLAALLVAIAISLITSRLIAHPVEKLTRDVKEIIKDIDLSLEASDLLNRDDEIGNLTRVINNLHSVYHKTIGRIIENNIKLERLARLGEQVGGFTHEIQSPIGVVLTALTFSEDIIKNLEHGIDSNALKKSDLSDSVDKIHEANSLCLKNIEQTKRIIRSFKNISISQSDIQKEMINLRELIEDVTSSIELIDKSKKITVDLQVDESIVFFSHKGYLTQILSNLIQNSIYHGFHNRDTGTINISSSLEDNLLCIEYSDDGKGIPEDLSSEVFKLYYTSAKERGGSGLGLHIIKTIVHAYLNGTIELAHNNKPGAMFKITFPIEERSGKNG